MRKLLLPFALLVTVLVSAQSQPTALSLFFEKADYNLTRQQQMQIDEFTEFVADSGYNAIFIKGYADIDGSDKSNLELSEFRVEAVKQYINTAKYNIEYKCYGEKAAINNNKNEDEKSLNRRVDLIFWTNYNLIQKNKKPQVFIFAPNKTIAFTAAEGTKIKIPANSLVYSDGSAPYGDITIAITEYYSMLDIIQNKLETTSNNNILISDGMININANRNDKTLRLKGGTTMEVEFAERENNDGFSLFYGAGNANTDIVNWVPAINPTSIDKNWSMSGYKMFASDTISTWKSKFDYNFFGQRIKVTEHWEEHKDIWHDTIIVDKTINANKIILQSTQMGWINCDQFYNSKSENINIIVDLNKDINPELVLIFSDLKAMISLAKIDGAWGFYNVPKGEKVTIAGVGSGEGKLYFAKKEFVVLEPKVTLDFKETGIKKIQEEFAAFN